MEENGNGKEKPEFKYFTKLMFIVFYVFALLVKIWRIANDDIKQPA